MTLFRLTHNLCAAALAFCLSAPLSAQTFELSLEEGRVAARQAALSGQFALARDFALALTDADANDRAALVVLAAVQPQLGAARDGRLAGARAYRLSNTDGERYEAARLVALAAANEERYTLSQFWLRRAAANAPDDRAFQQTQQDYRGIRNLNPVSFNLAFSITPSSNINGGSETDCLISIPSLDTSIDSFCVAPFSGDAQALSGLAATADARIAYAFSRGSDHRTSVIARAYARAVWLSDDAETISPDSRNSDFGSQVLELGLSHQRRLGDGSFSADFVLGGSWFSEELVTTYETVALTYGARFNDTLAWSVSGELQQTNLKTGAGRSNLRSTLAANLTYFTQDGNRLSGQLKFDAQSSEAINDRYETLTAQVSYAWADPIGPMQLSVTGGITGSHFRDYYLPFVSLPDGRQDTRVFGSVTAVFNDINYAGFVPVVTVGVQDTQSNVSRFERNEYSLNIGIRSSF